MMPRFKNALAAAVLLTLGSGANAVITNFSTDVSASIDAGLAWQDAAGAYTGSAGEGTGLSLLALLEKRQSADPASAPQGYVNASAADKAGLDHTSNGLLDAANGALNGVTKDPASVDAANQANQGAIDQIAGDINSQTISLTANQDAFGALAPSVNTQGISGNDT